MDHVPELRRHTLGDGRGPCSGADQPVGDERTDGASDEDTNTHAGDALQDNHADDTTGCPPHSVGDERPGKSQMLLAPLRDAHRCRAHDDEADRTDTGGYREEGNVEERPDGPGKDHAPDDDRCADQRCEPDGLALDCRSVVRGHGHAAGGECLSCDSDRGDDDEQAQQRTEGTEIRRCQDASRDHAQQVGGAIAHQGGRSDEHQTLGQRGARLV